MLNMVQTISHINAESKSLCTHWGECVSVLQLDRVILLYKCL